METSLRLSPPGGRPKADEQLDEALKPPERATAFSDFVSRVNCFTDATKPLASPSVASCASLTPSVTIRSTRERIWFQVAAR